MASKMAILILGLLAMLLFISSQVTARTLNGGEVVRETNGDGKLVGGGRLLRGGFPGYGGGYFSGGGGFPGGGFPRQGYCRFGCCRWAYWWGGCLRCCTIRTRH